MNKTSSSWASALTILFGISYVVFAKASNPSTEDLRLQVNTVLLEVQDAIKDVGATRKKNCRIEAILLSESLKSLFLSLGTDDIVRFNMATTASEYSLIVLQGGQPTVVFSIDVLQREGHCLQFSVTQIVQ